MCGILAIVDLPCSGSEFRERAVDLAKTLRHRGPDWSGVAVRRNAVIAHERLAIVDPVSGSQPLLSEDGRIVLAVNGEIYNHEVLRSELEATGSVFKSRSDCEVILHLYERCGDLSFIDRLEGMFAFVIFDDRTGRTLAARDALGIIPLYIGWGRDGSIWFSSEMKAIAKDCANFMQFAPGHSYDSKLGTGLVKWWSRDWFSGAISVGEDISITLSKLRSVLSQAVKSHLMADVPFGVLLSGGLDSSLIAALAVEQLALSEITPRHARLRSFSVGLQDSPDLKAAASVASFLGTEHMALTFTIQEGLDALSDVIYHIESYDVTTVRASTPMYLLARLVKAAGIKMVLSGEGADELFAGYLYFHKAPNAGELHKETVRKLFALHQYDCLRANKAMAAWGVEARVPFLDKNVVDFAMTVDPELKMCKSDESSRIEKWLVRSAFDTTPQILPSSVLWRQKEQFSDGVGYGWIDALKAHANQTISDNQMSTAPFRFPESPPLTKEAYMYREIFEKHFPSPAAAKTVPGGPSIACSSAAAIEWDKKWKDAADPSGRAVNVHEKAL